MPRIVQIRVYRPVAVPTLFTAAQMVMRPPTVLRPGGRKGMNDSEGFHPRVHDVDIEQHGFKTQKEFEAHWFIAGLVKDGHIEIVRPEAPAAKAAAAAIEKPAAKAADEAKK